MPGKPKKLKLPPAALSTVVMTVLIYAFTALFYSNSAMDTALMPRRCLLMALVGIFTITFWRRAWHVVTGLAAVPYSKVLASALLVILSTSLSGVFHVTAMSEFLAEIAWIVSGVIMLIFLIQLLDALPSPLIWIARVMGASALILSAIACLQYFDLAFQNMPGNYVVYATMTNKNLLANVLVLHLPLIGFGIIRGHNKELGLFIPALMVTLFILVISATRSAWLSCTVAAVLTMAAFQWSTKRQISSKPQQSPGKNPRLRLLLSTALVACSLGILSYQLYTPQNALRDKALTGATIQISSVQERLTIWQKTLRMIVEYPVTGVGAGQWKFHLPKYGAQDLRSAGGSLNFVRPHNDIIWITAERGWPALAGYLVFNAVLVMLTVKLLLRHKQGDREIALIVVYGLSAYFISSCFSFPRERVIPSLLQMTFVALVIDAFMEKNSGRPLTPGNRRLSLLITGIISTSAIVTSLIFGSRWHSEYLTRGLLKATHEQKWPAVVELASNAATRVYEVDPTGIPIASYAGQAYVQMRKYEQADSAFVLSQKLHPNHLLTLGNLVAVHHRSGDLDRAISLSRQALKISPHFDKIIINLAIIYIQKKQYQKAREAMEQCDPYSVDPRVESLKKRIESLIQGADRQHRRN